jgi:hypothetical protein
MAMLSTFFERMSECISCCYTQIPQTRELKRISIYFAHDLEAGKYKDPAAAYAWQLVRAFFLHHNMVEGVAWPDKACCSLDSLSLSLSLSFSFSVLSKEF